MIFHLCCWQKSAKVTFVSRLGGAAMHRFIFTLSYVYIDPVNPQCNSGRLGGGNWLKKAILEENTEKKTEQETKTK